MYVENIVQITIPSALMLQPFLDSQVCRALNMPTTFKPKIFQCVDSQHIKTLQVLHCNVL